MQESLAKLAPFWFELRKRMLHSLIFFALAAVVLMGFSHPLFYLFSSPILHTLPANQPLIAVGVISGFWVPIELSIWLALVVTMPFLLWQLWHFIRPALKTTEKFWGRFYLSSSFVLMLMGIAFGYFIVLPVCLHFLLLSAPANVKVMPDIVNYVNFSGRLLWMLALASQLPLIIVLLVQLKLVTIAQIKSIRRYVIVAAFVVGMIIAPDVISQCFLAIPLWLLYEVGLLLTKLLQKRLYPL